MYLVVAVLVAAGIAVGVWSGTSHDQYGPSGNGCVTLTFSSPAARPATTAERRQSRSAKKAFANSDRISLLARPQCNLAS